MASRSALAVLAAASMLPTAWRVWASRPAPARSCVPEGRGSGDRSWVGCAADPGAPRALSARERIAFGLPLPLNAASAEELAVVPGLSPRLARAVVTERERGGRFEEVDSLLRVQGVGPRRLARARAHLIAE